MGEFPWTLVPLSDLEQLIVWLDWAEHHAMHEMCVALPDREVAMRYAWQGEIKKLAKAQLDLRQTYEARTGHPIYPPANQR